MSKKFKKLICGVLALAMLATSGIASLADETTAAATAETAVTETVADTEAVAEATATPEPTAVPDPYAADAYYQKALGLCSALGIITGYDDGSVKPESTVTRAEMAAIILRMTNLSSLSTYRSLYTDVTSAHWAANTIQTASDEGVINGMGDGTFNPDGNVLYEQAVKMVVCGMNYDNEAELKGGYPEGYLAVAATNLSLLKSVSGSRGVAITRGEIIKMVYNALIGPYNDLKTYDGGQPVYESKETLAKAKFDVFEAKGLLTGTSTMSIVSVKPAAGQITIDSDDVDTDTFLCDLTGIDNLVGNKITFYYINDNSSDEKVIAILTDAAKTREDTISASDIEKFSGFEDGVGEIETYAGKKYKTEDATVIYNGEYITPGIYKAAVAADTTGRFDYIGYDGVNYTEENGDKMTFDQFIKPRVGSVRLVDNNSDGDYDIMFVESVETLVITAATDKKVTGEINNEAVTIDVETTDLDKTVTVTLDGTPAKPKNLKKNNVVSLKRNLDNDVFEFTKVDNSITGKITNLEAAEETYWAVATINGQEYEVDVNALSDAESGVEGTFVLDQFNRLGYVASDSVITSSEKYGWILSAYLSDAGDEYLIRMFTQDGQAQEYKFASKVSYWAPDETEPTSYTTSELNKELSKINYNRVGNTLTGWQIRLVKYSLNSKNEVTKLYVATTVDDDYTKGSVYSESEKTYSKNALMMNTTNMNTTSLGNLLGSKYYMSDGMIEFTVPNSDNAMSDASNYSVATANASSYLAREGGINKDCIFGEFSDEKQTNPTVVIRFVGAANEAAKIEDYGTADNNPCFMVKKIYEGVDDNDEIMYTIVGYQNGGEVRYETKANTLVARRNQIFPSKDKYGAVALWDAIGGLSNAAKAENPDAEGLKDVIGVGDIVGVENNGSVFIIMVDASEVADAVRSGSELPSYYSCKDAASDTRDILRIGFVTDAELAEEAIMSLQLGTTIEKFGFDTGRSIDTLVIDEGGNATLSTENISDISTIEPYDADTQTGDFAFVRHANKGGLQEIFLYRFEG